MSSIPLQDRRGFTIVELLIVIVVIGILAAITLVAFNGIQARTTNTKTTTAAAAWAKAFRMYHTENGAWPATTRACLGADYKKDFSGNGAASAPECRGLAGDTEKSELNTALAPYLGGTRPSPDMTAVGTSSDWFRGILLYQSGSDRMLAVVQRDATTCPDISGTAKAGATTHDGGMSCRYQILVP